MEKSGLEVDLWQMAKGDLIESSMTSQCFLRTCLQEDGDHSSLCNYRTMHLTFGLTHDSSQLYPLKRELTWEL